MGHRRILDIPKWRGFPTDPDAASPVGSVQARERISLTRCRVSEQTANVEYGPEEEGFVLWRERPIEVRTEQLPPTEARTIVTLELSTTHSEVNRHTAILAYYPYHLDWFGFSPFKRVQKRGRAASDRAVEKILLEARESATNPEPSIWATFMSLSTDPFGGEGHLYARFRDLTEKQRVDFLRTDQLAIIENRTYPEDPLPSLHDRTKPNREPDEDPAIYAGVCGSDGSGTSLKDCRDLIRHSDLIVDVMDSVSSGELSIGDEVILIRPTARTLSSAILEASIIKALAGPTEKHRKHIEKQEDLVARYGAVALVARSIFEDQLLNLNRRLSRGEDAESPFLIESTHENLQIAGALVATPAELEMSDAELKAWMGTAVKNVAEKKNIDPQVLWLNIRLLLSATEARSVITGCVYAAAAAQIFTMPDDVIQMLLDLERGLPSFKSAAQLALNYSDLSKEQIYDSPDQYQNQASA